MKLDKAQNALFLICGTTASNSMNNASKSSVTSDALAVLIHPDDADQVFVAGVQFARALAGAEPAAFMLALGEQQALIQDAILKAGFPDRKAQAAGEAFEAGARVEWQRIGNVGRPAVWGTA